MGKVQEAEPIQGHEWVFAEGPHRKEFVDYTLIHATGVVHDVLLIPPSPILLRTAKSRVMLLLRTHKTKSQLYLSQAVRDSQGGEED